MKNAQLGLPISILFLDWFLEFLFFLIESYNKKYYTKGNRLEKPDNAKNANAATGILPEVSISLVVLFHNELSELMNNNSAIQAFTKRKFPRKFKN